MSFDPTKPVDSSQIVAAELRSQFTALKALLDAQPAFAYGKLAADWTSASTSFTDVTGLSLAVGAGENWTAEIVLHAIGGAGGQGLKFRVAGPGAGSVLIALQGTGSSGSTAMECEVQTAFGVASPAKSFCLGTTLTGVVRVHLTITNATAGSVQLQASSTAAGTTVTLKANSDLVARRTG
jgi:hypothetical protein